MGWSITINGTTYTDANFNGNNYAQVATGLPQLLADFVAHAAGIFQASSSNSLSVANGTITPTITINRPYLAGQTIRLQRISDSTCYIQGPINSYNPATGALSATINTFSTGASGSGPFTDWVINFLGLQGATGATGPIFTGGTVTSNIVMSAAADNWALASIASAATMNIGAAAANILSVTGTTTITAFDTVQAGTLRVLLFSTALTLTHNAASLVLPWEHNLQTTPGDSAIMVSLGGGNWQCVDYNFASINVQRINRRARLSAALL